MTIRSLLLRRSVTVPCCILACVFALLAVVTWPRIFVSQGRELTGTSLDLEQIVRVDDGSMREGAAAWVYRLPDRAADALDSDRQRLRRFPMWSALAFDGYRLVRWQTLAEMNRGADRILADSVFRSGGRDLDPANVSAVGDAHDLASFLVQQETVLVSGWYTESKGVVTNYFVYVLDLRRRLMVKLSLLT